MTRTCCWIFPRLHKLPISSIAYVPCFFKHYAQKYFVFRMRLINVLRQEVPKSFCSCAITSGKSHINQILQYIDKHFRKRFINQVIDPSKTEKVCPR